MKPRCFVIQPFDDGEYDKRYEDTIKPSIRKIGFEAYRVDGDASSNDHVETIEREIRSAAACLADISLSRENVWYELGYARALNQENICMICKKSARERLPFDIATKNVIFYSTDSSSDFESLSKKIQERLSVLLGRWNSRATCADTVSNRIYQSDKEIVESLGFKFGLCDLGECELTILCSILGNGKESEYEERRILAVDTLRFFKQSEKEHALVSLEEAGAVERYVGEVLRPNWISEHSYKEETECVKLTEAGQAWLRQHFTQIPESLR